jgi:hypothetical protein
LIKLNCPFKNELSTRCGGAIYCQTAGDDSMGTETTPPSESTPERVGLPPAANSHIFLTGNPSFRSLANGAVTHISETPLPLRMVDPAILSNSDQPQPPRRRPPFVPGGPVEPPYPPPTSNAGVGIAAGVGTFVLNGEPADPDAKQSRFETLEARVAVLEAALAARPSGVALASRPPGIGHNHGPYIDENLNVDEASIQALIALLKVPRATAPIDLAKLAEAARVADPDINKWQERVDQFVKNVLKGATIQTGMEITKQLAHASWVRSVFSALQSVYEVLKDLFF